MKKYEDKIKALENEAQFLERNRLSILREKYEIAEKLHLVLYYFDDSIALAAIQWANQTQKSGSNLLPKVLQYPLSEELEKELSK